MDCLWSIFSFVGSPTGAANVERYFAQIFSAAVSESGSGGACKTLEGVLNYPREQAEVAQLVEHHLAMVRVARSNPVFRSYPGAEGVGELAAWPSG